jgi:MoxR-like ATPase
LGNNPNTAAALQMLLASLTTNNGLDADAVRTIVRDELPSLIPVTRLEIKTFDGIVTDHGTEPRHKTLPTLITVLSQNIPAALVGPAGSGKTTAAEQAARALNIPFLIQGAVQGAHELLGFVDAHGRYQSTPFRQAFEHGGVICLDELDAGDSAGVLVCNSALANGCMPFPDTVHPVPRHKTFNVVACLNTYGTGADRVYVGRNQLDGATLDRFAFLSWGYDERMERALIGAEDNGSNARALPASTMTPTQWVERVQSLRKGAEKEKARIVISPRATIYGARLIAAGMAQNTIEECLIWKGTDSELRRRIEASAI